jgi:hypothetical protein
MIALTLLALATSAWHAPGALFEKGILVERPEEQESGAQALVA